MAETTTKTPKKTTVKFKGYLPSITHQSLTFYLKQDKICINTRMNNSEVKRDGKKGRYACTQNAQEVRRS